MRIRYTLYQNLIFCLYLVSGDLKFIFSYYGLPVDITILFLGLVVIDMGYNLLIHAGKIKITPVQAFFLVVFFAFYLLFFTSLVYTPSEFYSIKKTSFFLACVIAFTYPLFMQEFNLRFFCKVVLITFIPCTIWFIIVKSLYRGEYKVLIGPEFESILGAYLGLANGIALLIFYFFEKRKYYITGILMALLFALGARGPVIFVLLAILVYKYQDILLAITSYRISWRIKKITALIGVGTAILVAAFWNTLVYSFQIGMGRFATFVDFGHDNSTNERLGLLTFAVKGIVDSVSSVFVGHGVGSFGYMFSGVDSRNIPHNIFLEAWFEMGFFSFILIALLSIGPLLLRNRNRIVCMMVFFLFLDSMKSGGFEEMRFTFGFYGILLFAKVYEYYASPRLTLSLSK